MLTQAELKSYFFYNPDNGNFYHLQGKKQGMVAGCQCKILKYYILIYKSKKYYSHRMAWLYMTGEMPKGDIDHIDGDRANNKWSNIRDGSTSDNMHNRKKAHKNNKTGYLGVSYHKMSNRYRAEIQINYKSKCLGSFKTPEEAHQAYLKAKREIHRFCTI